MVVKGMAPNIILSYWRKAMLNANRLRTPAQTAYQKRVHKMAENEYKKMAHKSSKFTKTSRKVTVGKRKAVAYTRGGRLYVKNRGSFVLFSK